jgi:hypothetical protein
MATILEIEISCSQWEEGSAFTQIALILKTKKFWVGLG